MCVKKLVISTILVGIVILVLSQIVNYAIQMVLPYNIFELGGMRSATDPLMALYFIYPFVLAFAMSYVYVFTQRGLKGTEMQKGIKYGLLMWGLVGLTSAFMVYVSMNYPLGFTVDSVLGSLIYMVPSGIVIARFMKE
jgi:hypothetical protein